MANQIWVSLYVYIDTSLIIALKCSEAQGLQGVRSCRSCHVEHIEPSFPLGKVDRMLRRLEPPQRARDQTSSRMAPGSRVPCHKCSGGCCAWNFLGHCGCCAGCGCCGPALSRPGLIERSASHDPSRGRHWNTWCKKSKCDRTTHWVLLGLSRNKWMMMGPGCRPFSKIVIIVTDCYR